MDEVPGLQFNTPTKKTKKTNNSFQALVNLINRRFTLLDKLVAGYQVYIYTPVAKYSKPAQNKKYTPPPPLPPASKNGIL